MEEMIWNIRASGVIHRRAGGLSGWAEQNPVVLGCVSEYMGSLALIRATVCLPGIGVRRLWAQWKGPDSIAVLLEPGDTTNLNDLQAGTHLGNATPSHGAGLFGDTRNGDPKTRPGDPKLGFRPCTKVSVPLMDNMSVGS